MIDPGELKRMRLRVLVFLVVALALTLVGASTSVMLSDAAYTVATLMIVGMTGWMVRWAELSKFVWKLVATALVLVCISQTLDLTENFTQLDDVPILGSHSPWNGKVASLSFLAGLVLTLATLMFALIEARLVQDHYRLLADNVSDVISIFNLEHRCTYVSPAIMQLRGYSVQEALVQPLEERMTPEACAVAQEHMACELQRIRDGLRGPSDVTVMELELLRKDGSTVWVETSLRFLTDRDGNPTQVLGVTRDISARRAAEDVARQLTERLTLAIRGGDLGVWDWNVASNELVWDERMFAIYGLNPSEHPGAYLDWRKSIVPEDLARAERDLIKAIKGRGEFHSQFRVIHPDGAVRHVESRAVVLCNESGRLLRVTGMNADITDRVETEAERARLQEQLSQAQKMESIGRLAGGVAHDFNNMLLVILGHAELAGAGAVNGALQNHIGEIRNAALRSADLTRQLLAFARQQAVAPRPMDLNLATDDMRKLLERLIGESIRLNWSPGAGLWKVKMDPSQVDQILANLCVNARDAIDGVGEISIKTENVTLNDAEGVNESEFTPGDYVRLSVRDNGCGMEPAVVTRIFEPFYTTKKPGKGTGLGLSTVYGIVRQNNGFIGVKSEPGRGTTFVVDLPRSAGVFQPDGRTGFPTQQIPSGSEVVLVVEDDVSILKLTRSMLEKLGYTVITAGTPVEAVRIAGSEVGPIHLLLTDIVMPEMNGRDLAAVLTATFPGLRSIYMSGYTADVISQDEIQRERVNFIQKPFGIQELATKVRHALDS